MNITLVNTGAQTKQTKHVLVLNTGGTIGMTKDVNGKHKI